MENYMSDKEDGWYVKPSNVVGVIVNPITGKPASNDSEKKKLMYFVKGTEPRYDDPVFDEITS